MHGVVAVCYPTNSQNDDKCQDDGKEDSDLQTHVLLRSAVNIDAPTFRRFGCLP